MKSLILFLLTLLNIIFFASESFSQYIPIDSVRRQDANGVPLLLGQSVTVRGVVTTQRELGNLLVYFQDPTGGLVAYDTGFCAHVNRGDSIQVTGVVTQYSGLTELTPVTAYTLLGTGINVNPTVVTTTNIRVGGEPYEGKLIRINNITKVKTTGSVIVHTWTVTGSGTNYRIFAGGDSCDIRIYATTSLVNASIPDTFSVIAVNSQFCVSPPYTTGYQIIPRSLTDIIPLTSGPLISQITYSNITQSSVTINWTSSAAADSRVRWMTTDSNYQNIVYTDSIYDAAMVTNHAITLNGLQSGRVYIYNVTSASATGITTSQSLYFCTQSTSSGTVNVYFNNSVDTTLNSGEPAQGYVNFQTKLLSRINAAQYSIDMALYSCDNLTQVRDALISAKVRGVKIRFVYDSRTNQSLVNDLIAAGIPIIKRPATSALMHNKFFVFDFRNNTNAANCWVWTGSTNVTQQQFYNDLNNVIEVQDRTLAAIYTREFEEMWGSAVDLPIASRSKFGNAKTDNVPHILNVNGTRMEAYFSPGDNGSSQIQNMITNYTDYDVFFSIYAFTDFNISNRMKSKRQAGKNIRGVFDRDTASGVCTEISGHGQYAWNPPGDVVIDYAETNGGYLYHHKYMIIDPLNANSNPVLETGSFNYSNAANNNNDENFVMVFSPRVANLYLQEWYKRYRNSGGLFLIAVEQISSEIPARFELKQNFPNPFNPSSTIIYNIPRKSNVMLKVYDITGREVQTLVNESQTAGTYKVDFKGVYLASGVYFYTLSADGVKIDTKKMVLVK
jgi:phosphatidylserine/phosphatidylglycerophosphate/cardiolipin synthase-like enzyme